MGLVVRESPGRWSVKLARFHGPNMVSSEVVLGVNWTPLNRAYLTPSTLEHLPDLEDESIILTVKDSIILGDLNTDIGRLKNLQFHHVADLLASFGMVDLISHLRQGVRF